MVDSVLRQFAGLRVLVLGDFIADEYVLCQPTGTSQVDPTIVVEEIERRQFLGGAGIVAAHCAGLGATTTLVTLLGSDDGYRHALGLLSTASVDTVAVVDATRPTTLKRRYRAQDKTLLRINRLSHSAPSADTVRRIGTAALAEVARKPDLVLFADFNLGTLTSPIVSVVSAEARRLGVMMAADNQASSELCDICRYRGMALVTPTEREARLSLRDATSSVISMAQVIRAQAVADNVAVTLGPDGLVLATASGTLTMPAMNRSAVDPVGAGDALFAVTSMALKVGHGIEQAIWLGSVAAAVQVSRVGNLPLTFNELVAFVAAQSKNVMGHGVIPGVDDLVTHAERENVVEIAQHKRL